MIAAKDVRFLGYKNWRGPFWRGSAPFDLPTNPSEIDVIMDVISKTEGRYHDSYNGYDSCRMTISPIQVCERGQYTGSGLLGHLMGVRGDRDIIKPVEEFGKEHGFVFMPDHKKRWRFHFLDDRGSVDRDSELTQLVWRNSSGKKDDWAFEDREYAKGFAAAVINVMRDPRGHRAQRDWLGKRVKKYAFKHAAKLVKEAPDTPVGKALVAGLLSFCINNPSWAAKHCQIADENWQGARWTEDWLVHVMRQCTFGPRVAIYPHRWDAIRGPMERHFGLDLPDFSADLKKWEASAITDRPVLGKSLSTKEAQWILRHVLFCDLGRSGDNEDGVDGVYGKKTKGAVEAVQVVSGLVEQDGWIGKDTLDVLLVAKEQWDNLSDDQRLEIEENAVLDMLLIEAMRKKKAA
jgi:hypothetical protein